MFGYRVRFDGDYGRDARTDAITKSEIKNGYSPVATADDRQQTECTKTDRSEYSSKVMGYLDGFGTQDT